MWGWSGKKSDGGPASLASSSKTASGTSSAASSAAGTGSIRTAITEADGDKVMPIVVKIKSREKENEEAMKKLRQAILDERKGCLQMRITIEQTRQIVNALIRENERLEAELKEALQNVKKISARKEREVCVKDEHGNTIVVEQFPVEEFQGELKTIKQKLDEVLKEKEALERTDKEKCPGSGKRPLSDEVDPLRRLQLSKDLNRELKQIAIQWLGKVADLKTGKPNEQPPTTFPEGIQHILQFAETKMAAVPNVVGKTKQSSDSEKRKSERHGVVTKRLAERKPLESLPSKIRGDYEYIAQERQNTMTLPDKKDNTVEYLADLYEWGQKELDRHKDQLAKLGALQQSARNKAEEDEKLRQKLSADLNAEIKLAEQTLEKTTAENRDCRRLCNMPCDQTVDTPQKTVAMETKMSKTGPSKSTENLPKKNEESKKVETKKMDGSPKMPSAAPEQKKTEATSSKKRDNVQKSPESDPQKKLDSGPKSPEAKMCAASEPSKKAENTPEPKNCASKIPKKVDNAVPVQKETRKAREEAQKTLNQLETTKAQKEEELRRLEEEIREQKRRMGEDQKEQGSSTQGSSSSDPGSTTSTSSTVRQKDGHTDIFIIKRNTKD